MRRRQDWKERLGDRLRVLPSYWLCYERIGDILGDNVTIGKTYVVPFLSLYLAEKRAAETVPVGYVFAAKNRLYTCE